MIEVNGMAHVILTVSQYDAAKAFYTRLPGCRPRFHPRCPVAGRTREHAGSEPQSGDKSSWRAYPAIGPVVRGNDDRT